MQVLILLSIAITAVTASVLPEPSNYDYHRRFGIPNALSIKEAENSISGDVGRIVGGTQSPLGLIPYIGGTIISLNSGLTSVCASTLLTYTRSLTAAHCWWDGFNQAYLVTVVYGSVTLFSGGVRFPTNNVTMHQSWNPNARFNDIAMINHVHVTYTNYVRNIALPAGAELSNTFVGYTGTLSGFGRNSDLQQGIPNNQTLHYTSAQIIANNVCQASFGNNVQPSTMCTSGAGGRGMCGGDSGAPLAVWINNRYILGGVGSFHSGYCQAGYPSAYMRVTYYINWILSRL